MASEKEIAKFLARQRAAEAKAAHDARKQREREQAQKK